MHYLRRRLLCGVFDVRGMSRGLQVNGTIFSGLIPLSFACIKSAQWIFSLSVHVHSTATLLIHHSIVDLVVTWRVETDVPRCSSLKVKRTQTRCKVRSAER